MYIFLLRLLPSYLCETLKTAYISKSFNHLLIKSGSKYVFFFFFFFAVDQNLSKKEQPIVKLYMKITMVITISLTS